MFDRLSARLSGVFERLRPRGVLTEADVDEALREIRLALLEADVALSAVKLFISQIRDKALGQDVIRSVTPGQMVVHIVQDHLVEFLGREARDLNLATQPPAVMLIIGLQGSGKTTTTAKLGLYLQKKMNKRVTMASLDIYRPAAQQQLTILGQQAGVDTLPIQEGEIPVAIAKRALETARRQGFDILLLDSAGRLHIDEALMQEIQEIKKAVSPIETLLVADSMMGQDALTTAQTFHEQVGITGLMMTRLDGDARGGAALSMLAVTGRPIKFIGVGEKLNQFEPFHPARMASRILGMGDIVSLVEKASETFSREETEKIEKQLRKGQFTLNDLMTQLEQMLKMGGIGSLMGMLPGLGGLKEKLPGIDDRVIRRQIAIIRSMTLLERRKPEVLNGSRRRRISAGAGVGVPEVNQLLKQFQNMQLAMKKMKNMGAMKSMRLLGGLKNIFKQ